MELKTVNREVQIDDAEFSTFANDLSGLLAGADIAILILDERLRIRRFTAAAQRLLNLVSSDIGRPFDEIASNLEPSNWNELISRVTHQTQSVETDIADVKGRWYLLRMRPYKTSEKSVGGVLMAFLDVSGARSQLGDAEERLKASQELFRPMAENTRDLVSLHSTDGKYIYASPSRGKLLGYGMHEIIGKLPVEFCREDYRRKVSFAFKKPVRSRKPTELTYCVLTRSGREVWLEALISPILDEKGEVTRVVAASRDITERKASDDRIRERELTVRTLVESVSQGIVVVDSTGKIVMANRAAEVMFGCKKTELLATRIHDLVPREYRLHHLLEQKFFTLNGRSRPADALGNVLGHRKDGKDFPAEIRLSYIKEDQGTLAVAFITDLSERKRAEAALRESHDKLLDLSGRLISAQDQERRRMSRELHDAFTQELAALTTESRLVKRELPPQARAAAQKVEEIAHRIGRLAIHIQQMSRRLHPAILDDLGLVSALRSECHGFSQLYGIQAEFKSGRIPQSVPANTALCIYRITQESLQNVAKHSGSSKVRVDLDVKSGEIRLGIRDSGRGFDLQAQKRRKRGLGLIGMEERARLVGGILKIESDAKKGTRVMVRIPLKDEQ